MRVQRERVCGGVRAKATLLTFTAGGAPRTPAAALLAIQSLMTASGTQLSLAVVPD
jgi:hypothetical protein